VEYVEVLFHLVRIDDFVLSLAPMVGIQDSYMCVIVSLSTIVFVM